MADQNSNEPHFAIISEDFIDNLICTSFLTDQQAYTKTIRPLGLMDYEFKQPIRPTASWAIDSYSIRPRGLIVNFKLINIRGREMRTKKRVTNTARWTFTGYLRAQWSPVILGFLIKKEYVFEKTLLYNFVSTTSKGISIKDTLSLQ